MVRGRQAFGRKPEVSCPLALRNVDFVDERFVFTRQNLSVERCMVTLVSKVIEQIVLLREISDSFSDVMVIVDKDTAIGFKPRFFIKFKLLKI